MDKILLLDENTKKTPSSKHIILRNDGTIMEISEGESITLETGITLSLGESGSFLLDIGERTDIDVTIDGTKVVEVAHLLATNTLSINNEHVIIVAPDTTFFSNKIEEEPLQDFDSLELEPNKAENLYTSELDLKFNEGEEEMTIDPKSEINKGVIAKKKRRKIGGKIFRLSLFAALITGIVIVPKALEVFKRVEMKRMTALNNYKNKLDFETQKKLKKMKYEYNHLENNVRNKLIEVLKPKRVSVKKKKTAVKIEAKELVKKKVEKPKIELRKEDKVAIMKEIEILSLEARLDPDASRSALLNLKQTVTDTEINQVIDQTLKGI
ncbi:MAG: hypothetical protein KC493_01545 [Bacteriovoracaceae bacterium]|nr:hypothetical protein [Bacteriovoracaceae bacterium]